MSTAPIATPFTVIIDTREQRPFSFSNLVADADENYAPLRVRTVRRGLRSGDYSLEGFEDRIAIERKSLADLYGTLGRGRTRFVRELERLNEMEFALVVIEASWQSLLQPPPMTQLSAKVVFRSAIAWSQRFPRVHWWPVGHRRLAEITTFRHLEKYWWEQEKQRLRAARKTGLT